MDKPVDTYGFLQQAYDYFNGELFGGKLPNCLITYQRKSRAKGYFCGDRYALLGHADVVTDEIALNPDIIGDRSAEETLSTLVHEMVHLWQHHFGDAPKTAYHNREWAAKMKEVGLQPTDTGLPGGKETGPKVTHMIVAGGLYQEAFRGLQAEALLFLSAPGNDARRAAKAASKTKYTCPECGMNAWAKPGAHVACGDCEVDLVA